MVDYARYAGKALHEQFRMLPDPWAKWLGYDVYRTRDLEKPVLGALKNGRMYLRDGMGQVDEIIAIGHEDAHNRFHPECVAYRELELFQIEKQETQANGIAVIEVYPSLDEFESDDQFRAESIMPASFTELRLAIRRKHGI
jgi:hypothetical protein